MIQSSLGRLYLLYFSQCLVFGCHGALEVLARPCDGVVTQRFFMVSGMGWLWAHCNGKSGLLIHTDRLLWPADELSFRWQQQQQTATQQTPDSYASQYVDFSLMSLVIPLQIDGKHSNRWRRHCSSVDWTHLFSPKAWHCVSSHTSFVCITTTRNTCPPPPSRKNLKLLGQNASYSPDSTIWLVNNSKL